MKVLSLSNLLRNIGLNMYIEYQCYDKVLLSDVKKDLFKAIDCGVDGVSVPVPYISKIKGFIPEDVIISCPVDYPNGFSDTDLRIHYAMKAVHCGATAIDLVANTFLYYHEKKEFVNDLKSIHNLCTDKGIKVRVMVNHKSLTHNEDYMPMLREINSFKGIEYVFCSTGLFSEDPIDNILLSRIAQEHFGFKAISNGNFYLPKHLNRVAQAKIFGVRFNNCRALKRCISVYNNLEDQD